MTDTNLVPVLEGVREDSARVRVPAHDEAKHNLGHEAKCHIPGYGRVIVRPTATHVHADCKPTVLMVAFSNTVMLYESGLGASFTSVTEMNAYTVTESVPDTLMASV